jgi:hypothetical protein
MGGSRATVLMRNRFGDDRGYAAQVWLRLLDLDAFSRRSRSARSASCSTDVQPKSRPVTFSPIQQCRKSAALPLIFNAFGAIARERLLGFEVPSLRA